MFRYFHHRGSKMFCSKHVPVQNLQMNRCLDIFTTEHVRCLLKAYGCSKPPEQMLRCFTKDQDCQMNRCLDVFTTEEIRCFAQSIWLFKNCRWIDVWMFHQIVIEIFNSDHVTLQMIRYLDVWMISLVSGENI